jgi:hypothetical protein
VTVFAGDAEQRICMPLPYPSSPSVSCVAPSRLSAIACRCCLIMIACAWRISAAVLTEWQLLQRRCPGGAAPRSVSGVVLFYPFEMSSPLISLSRRATTTLRGERFAHPFGRRNAETALSLAVCKGRSGCWYDHLDRRLTRPLSPWDTAGQRPLTGPIWLGPVWESHPTGPLKLMIDSRRSLR